MKSSEVKRKLEKDGWQLVRVNGSHHHFKHPTKPGLVTLPHPKSDIPKGTLRSIWKQAGWSWG
ncbi:type II toxin-antitoxin system HicA family toxin [Marinobacter sp.]|uniref:type II toxin-antitoxin system HicA family toxin n=1 Tax=Marinobacter sp. TaxID=50741 RepID=UPI0019C3CA28|nr:type II toxin-antitoxin system HicA family toxin [Marinobacter sp.]MBD3655346.1 type II toxin-antitoxin system HicA family toxin [Marinobacter sp.]